MLYQYDFSNLEREEILIAVGEMLINSIVHGNKSDPLKQVTITVEINCRQFKITTRDDGDGFDENRIPDPTDLNRLLTLLENNEEELYTHGRGVWMIKKLMDDVVFLDNGRTLTAIKNKAPINTCIDY